MADTNNTAASAKRARPTKNEQALECRERIPNMSSPLDLVAIYTGKGKNAVKFVIHKEFACYYCPVFKVAFNSKFVEGTTGEYYLEDSSENTVRILTNWLYTQRVDTQPLVQVGETKTSTSEERKERNSDANCNSVFMTLIELWVLADKLLMPRLQNDVLRELYYIMMQSYTAPLRSLHYLYANTAEKSGIRRLFLHRAAGYCSPDIIKQHVADFPHQFLLDVLAFHVVEVEEDENFHIEDYYLLETN